MMVKVCRIIQKKTVNTQSVLFNKLCPGNLSYDIKFWWIGKETNWPLITAINYIL